MEHYYKTITGWCDFEDIYRRAVQDAKDGDVLVELGTANGQSTAFLCTEVVNSGKNIHVYTCDIFEHEGQFNQHMWEYANSHLKQFPFCKVIHGSSIGTIHMAMKDHGHIDFAFMDADHSAVSVDDELRWLFYYDVPVIAGHDYLHPSYPDVKMVVDEWNGDLLRESPGVYDFEVNGTSFIFRKRKDDNGQ